MDKYDVLNVLIFVVIPVISVSVLFFMKRKLLWIAPLLSSMLAFAFYVTTLEPSIIKIFSNNEWRGFLILAMLMQFGVAAVLTAAGYLMAHILKRKNRRS